MNTLEFFLSERWPARTLLVLVLGAFYAGAILINNELLFPFADIGGSVFWFFFPEGIKFVLVMSLGMRGAVAVGLGRAAVTLNQYPDIDYVSGLAAGAVMALSTLTAMKVGSLMMNVAFPWREIHLRAMLTIALMFALTDAAAKIFAEFYIIGNDAILGSNPTHAFLVEAFGRYVGVLAFLYLVSLMRKAIRQDA